MARWWQGVVVLVLAGIGTGSVRGQAPLAFPPSAPPWYYNNAAPPPMPMYYPQGGFQKPAPPNGFMPPRGYPIPGAEDPQALIDAKASKNPFELPGTTENAFATETCCLEDEGFYFTIGVMGLARTGFGSTVIAVSDPRGNIDLPLLPPPNSPPAINFNNVIPVYNWGVRGAIGYRYGCEAVELFGYAVFPGTSTAEVINPGRLALPFAAYPVPVGLGIDNSQWLNADRVQLTYVTEVANVEANYRYGVGLGSEIILGLRYLDVRERFDILTDDNGLTANPPDPRNIVTYRSQTHNHILGPQLGWELENRFAEFFSAGLFTKLFAGANFYDANISIFRADGFTALDNKRSRTTLSGAWELGGYLDFLLLARLRVRLGYEMLWVINVPEAHAEVDFNIAENPYGSRRDHGSILYHGPMLEFMFAF